MIASFDEVGIEPPASISVPHDTYQALIRSTASLNFVRQYDVKVSPTLKLAGIEIHEAREA